jgi:hypothetical protein
MIPLLLMLAAVAASAADQPADRLPPEPVEPPRVRDLLPSESPPAIFTYRVDPQCRVTDTRKLQGPDQLTWEDAQRARNVYRETTAWRFVDGLRRQLREHRVKLLGEMIRQGELVCLVLPSGEVVEAWIERSESGAGRRETNVRETVTVDDDGIEDLGTFSLDFHPTPAAP